MTDHEGNPMQLPPSQRQTQQLMQAAAASAAPSNPRAGGPRNQSGYTAAQQSAVTSALRQRAGKLQLE